MKSKDFFTKLKETGGIDAEEFNALVEAVPDFEIADAAFEAFEAKFMTVDRAVADKEVTRRLKANILDPIDNEVKSILKTLGYENPADLLKGQDTYKSIALVTREIPKAIEKAGKGSETNEDFKKKLADKEKIISDLTSKFETSQTEFNTKAEELKKGFEDQIHDIKLSTQLEKFSSKYTFAEAYEQRREALENAILGDLKKSHKFQLAEKDGKPDIQVLNDDGSPKFQGNTPVTIKHLLDQAYEPFLKKSNGTGQVTTHTAQAQSQNQATSVRQGVRNTVR